jgi:hypothetical protein
VVKGDSVLCQLPHLAHALEIACDMDAVALPDSSERDGQPVRSKEPDRIHHEQENLWFSSGVTP